MESENWNEIRRRLRFPHENSADSSRPQYIPFYKQGTQEIDTLIKALQTSTTLNQAIHVLSLFTIRFVCPGKTTEVNLNPPALGISGSETEYSITLYDSSSDKILREEMVDTSPIEKVVETLESMFTKLREDESIS